MIAFVHINKTGGSTVKFILRNSFGICHCDVLPKRRGNAFTEDDLLFAKRLYWNLKSIAGHSLIHPTAYLGDTIQYFTLVRDPITRCASQYQRVVLSRRKNAKKPSFEEFISDEKNINVQVKRIVGDTNVERAKEELEKYYFFVGLTERFQESLEIFQKMCPLAVNIGYPRPLRQAPDNAVKESLLSNPKTYEMLEEANRADSELYQYVKNVIFPTQLEKAGVAGCATDRAHYAGPHLQVRFSRTFNNVFYKTALKVRRRLSHDNRRRAH